LIQPSADLDVDATIAAILTGPRVAHVVGLSPDPGRPSHGVARYLLRHQFEVVPINPFLDEWEGRPAFPDLPAVPGRDPLALVVVFRRIDEVAPVSEQALSRGVQAFWMQQGIVENRVAARLRAQGVRVVEDRCIAVEHALRRQQLGLP
jgi:predicted CoA-binding protein